MEGEELRVLELYSGVGGMHLALSTAFPQSQYRIVAAVDINSGGNTVYHHNFPSVKPQSRMLYFELTDQSVPTLPAVYKKGSQDTRSKSFLHILSVLPLLKQKPLYILMENVKGFEESDSRDMMIQQLTQCDYQYREFLLNPTQYRIPNSRLRYYMVAKLLPQPFLDQNDGSILYAVPGDSRCAIEESEDCHTIDNYLEDIPVDSELRVPVDTIKRYGLVSDLVRPKSRRTNCFTKNYAAYMEGTGSLLILSDEEGPWKNGEAMMHLCIRYFSPKEIANLMGFPATFSFPSGMSRTQLYKLMGNSLNVYVVSRLLRYLFNCWDE
ncbi:tRNA (cytosine(38)-C(5))-methyltransferase [Planoprotostelium fungivorum]|uniref:tRNA (cytosine(38)-C(5))-methyltransferase n=1 Tax=Planoprotostelium fungivorum TaxID=1890364 RepID=A0A2P6MY63_9EUKA|nr:tRNA (cytosine(38)-C(5))-methyltransferase [Planoprotostelium fungivorum]